MGNAKHCLQRNAFLSTVARLYIAKCELRNAANMAFVCATFRALSFCARLLRSPSPCRNHYRHHALHT
eukprot:6664488-Lingulodinium_polyedra.AAC.1